MSNDAENLLDLPIRSSPLGLLRKFALIATASLILGLLLPSVTALGFGVFFLDTMKDKIRLTHPEVIKRLDDFENQQQNVKTEISRIERELIDSPENANTRDALSTLRSEYQKKLNGKIPVSIQPLYLHILMYFWPSMYMCLGSLIFLLNPHYKKTGQLSSVRPRTTTLITIAVFFFSTWPLLFRNLWAPLQAQERIVWAYSNLDVDAWSFCVQLIDFAIYSLLLSIVWQQWSNFFTYLLAHPEIGRLAARKPFDHKILHTLTAFLLRSQAAILVISIPFMIYASVFWTQIISHKDPRFLFEAITTYVVWLTSILLIVSPFCLIWMRWWTSKQSTIIELVYSANSEDLNLEVKLSTLQELRPIGTWNIAASGFAMLSSLLLPILQAVIKH